MWHNYPFSQRTRPQKEQWGGGWRQQGRGSWTKFEKVGGGR